MERYLIINQSCRERKDWCNKIEINSKKSVEKNMKISFCSRCNQVVGNPPMAPHVCSHDKRTFIYKNSASLKCCYLWVRGKNLHKQKDIQKLFHKSLLRTSQANFHFLLFQAVLSEHSWWSSPSIKSSFSRFILDSSSI